MAPPSPAGGGEGGEAGPGKGPGNGNDDAPPPPPKIGFSLSLASSKKPATAAAALRPAALREAPLEAGPHRELISGVAGKAEGERKREIDSAKKAKRQEKKTANAENSLNLDLPPPLSLFPPSQQPKTGGKIASADPSSLYRGVGHGGAASRRPLVIPALENTFKVGGGGGGVKKAAATTAEEGGNEKEKGKEEGAKPPQRYIPEAINAEASRTNEERFESAGPEEAQRKGVCYGLQEMKKKRSDGDDDKAKDEAAAATATATAAAAADPLAGLSVTSREWEAARYKQDLSRLPDEGGEEDYERVPVESFARALLRGMGWQEDGDKGDGEGKNDAATATATATAVTRDGRKIDVGVVEFLPRPAGLGLGASLGPSSSAAAAPRKKDKRWELDSSAAANAANASSSLAPRGTTMVDASGRVRHNRRLGEELRPASEFGSASVLKPGTRVVVSGGPHSGVSASVVVGVEGEGEGDGGGEAAAAAPPTLVRVRLLPSDEEVVVRREHLELLEASSSKGGSGGSGSGGIDGGDRKRSHDEKEERDRRSHRSPPPPPPPLSASKRQRKRSPSPPESSRWLLPGIVVKIVDKRLEGGRFYLKRARVVDVPAPGIATLSVISNTSSASAASLSGVRASSLETAVPRDPGAAVVVVEGPHQGRRGKLLARMESGGSSSSKQHRGPTGAVQLRGDLEVVQLPFDWFAEAAGGGGGGEEWGRGGGGGGGGGDDEDDDE